MFVKYFPEEDTTWAGVYEGDEFVTTRTIMLHTHERDKCAGEWCAIHNPNPDWDYGRLYWRTDRNIMERICEHGVGHPTRESWEFWVKTAGQRKAESFFLHGCDQCCNV